MLALTVTTTGLYELVPRYRPSDQQLLDNADFGRKLAEWWTIGDVGPDPARSGTVFLESAGIAVGTATMRQTIELPGAPLTVFLRAKIAADIVEGGEGRKGGAWIMVGNLAGSSPKSLQWAKGSHVPYLTTSSHGWQPLEVFLDLPPGNRAATFEAGVAGEAGSVLRITDLAMFEAFERPSFRILRSALMLAWVLTALWVGAAIYRGLSSAWARSTLVVLIGAVALGLLMPDSTAPQGSLLEASALEAAGHALLFCLLALTLRLGRPRDPLWLSLGGLALFAAASEVVQLFVPGRGPEVHDLLADLAGILAGLALFRPALRLYGGVTGRSRANGDRRKVGRVM